MFCPSISYCYSYSSESVLSSDKSSIYSLFPFGTGMYSSVYLYFVCFNSLDGNILSSRYKSSIQSNIYVKSIVLYGDYVISIVNDDSHSLVIYSITTFIFTIKKFNGRLYSILLDSGNGR